MSGVCKQALRSLHPGMQNALIIGVIVNSFNMKTIDTTRTRCTNFPSHFSSQSDLELFAQICFVFESDFERQIQKKFFHDEPFMNRLIILISVNNGNRGVWTFTLRDSEEDSINVTVWGSEQFVRRLSSNFRIGSVGLSRMKD